MRRTAILLVCMFVGLSYARGAAITLTGAPTYGAAGSLQGQVVGVNPDDYVVVVYTFPGSWWIKPTTASPFTAIAANGSWSCNVVTGGNDIYATKMAAFLVPKTATAQVPVLTGADKLPDGLYTLSHANAVMSRPPGVRKIQFAGREWTVKLADQGRVGPGNNYFSDSTDSVWVDGRGQLHLKVRQSGGKWLCAEVVSSDSLGYGTYLFRMGSRVDKGALDANVVVGLFTWEDDAVDSHYREIDVEFGTWGTPSDPDGQFVVQPWNTAGNRERFALRSAATSTHAFRWYPGGVEYWSMEGHPVFPPPSNTVVHTWQYAGADTPAPGGEKVRLNLWLLAAATSDGTDEEIAISDFQFIPPLWAEATVFPPPNRWLHSSWLGYVELSIPPWVYHMQHAWAYPVGTSPDSLWLYTLDMGWLWTSQAVYPNVYRHADTAWLYYQRESSGPRRFYNWSTARWEARP